MDDVVQRRSCGTPRPAAPRTSAGRRASASTASYARRRSCPSRPASGAAFRRTTARIAGARRSAPAQSGGASARWSNDGSLRMVPRPAPECGSDASRARRATSTCRAASRPACRSGSALEQAARGAHLVIVVGEQRVVLDRHGDSLPKTPSDVRSPEGDQNHRAAEGPEICGARRADAAAASGSTGVATRRARPGSGDEASRSPRPSHRLCSPLITPIRVVPAGRQRRPARSGFCCAPLVSPVPLWLLYSVRSLFSVSLRPAAAP